MDLGEWFIRMPLGAVFIVTFVICMGSVEMGTALSRVALRRKSEKDPEAAIGALVGAILGLFAFFLAFTFGMTTSRYDARRQLVLDESNAIGTTYLRAALLPQSQRLEVRSLLREYADIRLITTIVNVQEMLTKSQDIHNRLWSETKSLVREDMDSEIRSLFIDSLNKLIDLHQSRKTVTLQYRIPDTVWLVVYLLSVLSMLTVGYQVGMSGVRRLWGTPMLAAAFSIVILMIADIDRPTEGFMRLSQQPIADVKQMMLDDSP